MRLHYSLRIFFVFLIINIFSSCRENTHTPYPVQASSNDSLQKHEIRLDTFSVSPETDSCSCFFSTDSIAYAQKAYIFAYNLETLAYVKINGTMTKFNQIEYSEIDDNSLTTFQSDQYKLYLELKDVRETGKEATLQAGSIRLMDTEKNVVITPFYGECSCKNPQHK